MSGACPLAAGARRRVENGPPRGVLMKLRAPGPPDATSVALVSRLVSAVRPSAHSSYRTTSVFFSLIFWKSAPPIT
jgi:hypothetical protein